MQRRKFLALGALSAVGVGTGISFANSSSSTSFGVSGSTGFGSVDTSLSGDTPPNPVHGSDPNISGIAGSAQEVGAGDLLYVNDFDAASGSAVWLNLILDNAGTLSSDYNYLNLEIGVHTHDGSSWAHETSVDINTLSLTRGEVSFILDDSTGDLTNTFANTTHVEISVEGGSSYIYSGHSDASGPSFTLEGREI